MSRRLPALSFREVVRALEPLGFQTDHVTGSHPERARTAARAIGIADERAYADHGELLAKEAERADGIDVLAIMTPNDGHYPVARDALARGLDVICDKPLTTTLEDALDLVRRVNDSGLVFCLTHNYAGYPLVRHARAMVRSGALGQIRQLHVEYIQGHLATLTTPIATRPPAGALRPSSAARRWCSATSAPMPTTWHASSRASSSLRSRPSSAAPCRDGR